MLRAQKHHRRRAWITGLRLFWLLAWVACAAHLQAGEAEGPGRAYLRAFRHHLDLAEQDISHIAELADGAADTFIERGRLALCPTQESFTRELSGRAGGLTGLQGWRPRRWVVEATHSWLNRNRAILIRWSKKDENHLALLQLGSGLIAFKRAHAARLVTAL